MSKTAISAAIVYFGGFGTKVFAAMAESNRSALKTSPDEKVIDLSAGQDTRVKVEKIILGDGKGTGSNPARAYTIGQDQLPDVLNAIDANFFIFTCMAGGGTGSGLVRVAAEWAAQNKKTFCCVIGMNHGSDTSNKNCVETIKVINAAAITSEVTIPVLPIDDDGGMSPDTIIQVRDAILSIANLYSGATSLDPNDVHNLLHNRAYPKGVCELSATMAPDPIDSYGYIGFIEEGDQAPVIETTYRKIVFNAPGSKASSVYINVKAGNTLAEKLSDRIAMLRERAKSKNRVNVIANMFGDLDELEL